MTPHPQRINVLQVLDSLGVGGAEQLALTLCKGLDREAFHVVVCTLFSRDPTYPEPLADEIRALGVRVEQLAMTRWRDRQAIGRFLRLIDEEHIDIVHGHMVPANFWGCLLAKVFRRRRTIYTCHQPFYAQGRMMRLQQMALNTWLADRVISISETTTWFVHESGHAALHKIIKIPNAVDTDRFTPEVLGAAVRAELGIPAGVPVIGNVGRYTPEKGYPFFIETAARVLRLYPETRFLAVGHGSERARLTRLIEEGHLRDRVILIGPRRDIPEIMGAIDIFLFTSIWGEGFGITLIEAMASGKPIIAANVGPTREIIEDGVTGLLPCPKEWVQETDHLDADALAGAVDFLLQRPDVCRQLGQEARRQAVNRFSIPAWIEAIQATYRAMMDEDR